jgi:hypothetical protein
MLRVGIVPANYYDWFLQTHLGLPFLRYVVTFLSNGIGFILLCCNLLENFIVTLYDKHMCLIITSKSTGTHLKEEKAIWNIDS